MTALIVIAIILLILLLLLQIRLRLHLEKEEAGPKVTLSVLFWTLTLYPRTRGEAAAPEQEEKGEKEKPRIQISEIPSALSRMADFLKRLSEILFTRLLQKIVLERLELFVAVATDDAAETALLYPKVSAGGYTVLSLLDGLITVKRYQVDILPDFCHNRTRWRGNADFSLRVMHILAAGIAILILLLKNRRRIQSTVSQLQAKG